MGKGQLNFLVEVLVVFFALVMVVAYAGTPFPLSLSELAVIDTILSPSRGQLAERSLFQLQNPDVFRLLSQWVNMCGEHLFFVRLPGIIACIALLGVFSAALGRSMPGWGGLGKFVLVSSPLTIPFYVQLLPTAPIALFLFLAFLCEVFPHWMKSWTNTSLFIVPLLLAAFLSPLSWPVVLVLVGMRCRRFFLQKIYAQSLLSCLPLLLIAWYWNLFASHWTMLSSKEMWDSTLATPSRLVQDVGELFLYGYHGMIPFGGGVLLVMMFFLCLFSGRFVGWKGVADEYHAHDAHDTLRVVKKGSFIVCLSFFLLWTVGRIGLAHVYAPVQFCSLLAPIWIFVAIATGRLLFHFLTLRDQQSITVLCLVISMGMFMNCVVQRVLFNAYNEPAKSLAELSSISSELGHDVFVLSDQMIPYLQGQFDRKLCPVKEIGDRQGVVLDFSARLTPRSPQDAWLLSQFPGKPDEEKNGLTRLEWKNGAGFHLFDLGSAGSSHLTEYRTKSPWPPISPWDDSPVDSLAAPYNQRRMHGWSSPEFDGWCSRWSSRDEMTLVFDRPLEKGVYRLHLAGYRNEFPWKETTLSLEIPGAFQAEVLLQPGGFRVEETVTIEQRIETPRLQLTHPTWIPAFYMKDSTDNRRLGFYFQGAWFEAVDSQ
jgi:hypothetical protein